MVAGRWPLRQIKRLPANRVHRRQLFAAADGSLRIAGRLLPTRRRLPLQRQDRRPASLRWLLERSGNQIDRVRSDNPKRHRSRVGLLQERFRPIGSSTPLAMRCMAGSSTCLPAPSPATTGPASKRTFGRRPTNTALSTSTTTTSKMPAGKPTSSFQCRPI